MLYGAAWLLVPEEGRADGTVHTSPATRNVLLIAAGVVAALLLVGDGWGGVGFPWPLFLVGTGVVLYLVLRGPAAACGGPAARCDVRRPGRCRPAATDPTYGGPAVADPTYTGPTYADPTYAGPPPDGTPPWLPAPQPAYQPPRRKRGPTPVRDHPGAGRGWPWARSVSTRRAAARSPTPPTPRSRSPSSA